MTNRFNESLPSFVPLHSEFLHGLRIIDNFSDCIAFNIRNKGKDNKHYAHQLDDLTLELSSSSFTAIITSDTSINNYITTSILHMHIYNNPIIKMVYYAVHVTSTEAKLFVIRCGINQALKFDNMSKVIVITDSIHMVKKSLNQLSIYTKSNQLLSYLIFASSSYIIRTIPLNFGNAQVISSGIFIMRLTKN